MLAIGDFLHKSGVVQALVAFASDSVELRAVLDHAALLGDVFTTLCVIFRGNSSLIPDFAEVASASSLLLLCSVAAR